MVTIANIARFEGADIREVVLEDALQSVRIMSYGAVTRDWRVTQGGRDIPVVLGFENFPDYPRHSRSFGIIAGRVANRTAFGRFSIGDRKYQLSTGASRHHLHGGALGFGRRNWTMEPDTKANAVRLTYLSEHDEEGYPGNLDVEVVITLADGELRYEMYASADRRTPVNLAQHNYYNLNGHGDVCDHQLRITASRYTPVDESLIPTGEILPVAGRRLDFRRFSGVTANDPGLSGIDHNLVLDADRNPEEPAAVLRSSETELELSLFTDQPGIQVFNAPQMAIPAFGHDRELYGRFAGLCLEPQHFPNYLNEPGWPQSFAEPDAPYRQSLRLRIAKQGT